MSAALSAKTFTVQFRFHGDLSFFLPRENRGAAITKTLREKTSVKDAIESCGIPHPEVDLIRCDDVAVPFEHSLTKNALVDVYGLTDSPANPEAWAAVAVMVYTALIAFWMVSRIPMFSFKKMRVSRHAAVPLLIAAGLLAVLAVKDLWLLVAGLTLVYLGTFPLSVVSQARIYRKN